MCSGGNTQGSIRLCNLRVPRSRFLPQPDEAFSSAALSPRNQTGGKARIQVPKETRGETSPSAPGLLSGVDGLGLRSELERFQFLQSKMELQLGGGQLLSGLYQRAV